MVFDKRSTFDFVPVYPAPPLFDPSTAMRYAYQPVFKNGAVDYFEILARPTRRGAPLPTADLLQEIQMRGKILEFDRLVLKHALAAMDTFPEVRFGVNVSGLTASKQAGFSMMNAMLRSHPAKRANLVVEVTETYPIQDLPQACRFTRLLQDFGSRVALDDFGASGTERHLDLALVDTLKPDVLKIDHSRTTHVASSATQQTYFATIVDFCRPRQIEICAEGAPCLSTSEWLTKAGVGLQQSYFLGTPDDAPRTGTAGTIRPASLQPQQNTQRLQHG